MKIKSFYADSMDLAMQSASRELGAEALILNSREAPLEFRHFGKYEVVCACAPVAPAEAKSAAVPLNMLSAPGDGRIAAVRNARLIVLVGPSGAGKSSACAKIAIHSKFTKGLSTAVLSWDSGRVGSSDSIRSYCEIAGIPFREIETRDAFDKVLVEFRDADLILVDTPPMEGDEVVSAELTSAIASIPYAETHLVLSGAYSALYLDSAYSNYARFKAGYLLPTHLDEAQMDLTAAGMERIGALSIQWCGTGRGVPEDLQDASQVMEQAAALAPQLEVAPSPPILLPESIPAPAMPSARSAIETILKRLRREDLEPNAHIVRASKSSAA